MLPVERHRTESREDAEPRSVMEAEWALQAVQKLQARLTSSSRPKKLQKYLKKLSALPITPGILRETGVRKTVKSLRKHELVGDLARDLVAQWKKLARLARNPGPGPQDSEQSRSPERPGDALQKEEMDRGYLENRSAPGSPWNSPRQGRRAQRELWASQRSSKRSHSREGRGESKKRPRVAAFPSGWGSSDCCHVQTAVGFSSPHQMSVDHSRSPEDPEPSASGHMPGQGQATAFQTWPGLRQEGPLDRPQEKEDLLPNAKEISDNVMNQKDGKSSDEEFEEPTMSFESYLTYDQPQKKKKTAKTSATAGKDKKMKENDSKRSRKNFDFVQNFPLMSGNQSEQWWPADVDSAEMEEFCTEAPPGLPDLPLFNEQATHSPPPTYDLMYSFQSDGTALSSPEKEEEDGYTGCRKYSKMQVYSGFKCGHLAQMASHMPGSQELTHNSSMLEESRLPRPVSQSVLKKCTPDQLYRMEKYNRVSAEETDELWRIHCHKEFKEEVPKENESWQEMYLRLQDAREQQLRALTRKIQSAHANKPQGRKTKMIFYGSTCVVPRSQEKFRTVPAAASEKAKFKPAQYPTGSSDNHSRSSSSSGSSSFNPAAKRPTNASLNTGRPYLAPVINLRKSTSKKIAPLMAKTIKDYNRQILRR